MQTSVVRALSLLVVCFAAPAFAQAPVNYRVSFPEAQHHRMQVEVTFPDVPPGTLEIVMSRSSPGRYALHEFAKNVYDVQIDNGAGAPLTFERPNPSQWNVAGHSGAVRVRYKVFGDRLDGTYLAIDATHAHLNMPASLMWARRLEDRPVRVTFEAPDHWNIATQLRPTSDPRTFTAANVHYLADSPTELSNFTLHTFAVDREFRLAVHHDGTPADVERFAVSVEKIVREERAIFGEFPDYEVPYTFIADYLPWAADDGMEHRNSTVLTAPYTMRRPDEQLALLSTIAHEFFHSWNVERIRPASLEPFELDAPNPSGELWFAEGFTSYYGPLTMRRTGLWSDEEFASRIGYTLDGVIRSPGRKYRSAEEMSRLAQFVDQAAWSDPTSFANHFISYYDWGAVIGLALDLSLRTRSDHKVTLDHYMRRLWQQFGRVPPPADGVVARPYTVQDLRTVLADVSGDTTFADEFFARFVHGRDVADFAMLLERAGFVLRKRNPGRAWIGPVPLEFTRTGARVTDPTIEDTPVYTAGLDRDDELITVDGIAMSGASRLEDVIQRRKPGDTVRMTIRRRGETRDLAVTIAEDPTLQLVPVERTGRGPSASERQFRDRWLGSLLR
jgi:predicted metalloprotease with PDZ domain